MGFSVICVGSATVDTYIDINQKFNAIMPGDKILMDSHTSLCGGGALNSAHALRAFSLKVGLIAKLGDDHNGVFVRKCLERAKIKHLTKNPSSKPTDKSIILSSSKEKDRVILVNKNASSDLLEREIPYRHVQNAGWIYLGTLLGRSRKVGISIAEHAASKNKKILLNFSSYLAMQGVHKLKSLLKKTTLLILNKKEAHKVLGEKSLDTKKMLQELQFHGPKNVIITSGTGTIWAIDGDTIFSLKPPKVPIENTAGAGDAFNSGVLAGLIKKKSFEESLMIGAVNAASVVQYEGTFNKHLSIRESTKAIKKYKLKVRKHNVR